RYRVVDCGDIVRRKIVIEDNPARTRIRGDDSIVRSRLNGSSQFVSAIGDRGSRGKVIESRKSGDHFRQWLRDGNRSSVGVMMATVGFVFMNLGLKRGFNLSRRPPKGDPVPPPGHLKN